MQVFDHLNPGDRATWVAFNGIVKGTVESVGPRGVLVRIDGGGDMVLSTVESYRNFINKTHINQQGEKDVEAGGSPAKASC